MQLGGSGWWPNHRVLAIPVRNPDGVSDSLVWPGPALAIVAMWGINQWMEDFAVSPHKIGNLYPFSCFSLPPYLPLSLSFCLSNTLKDQLISVVK